MNSKKSKIIISVICCAVIAFSCAVVVFSVHNEKVKKSRLTMPVQTSADNTESLSQTQTQSTTGLQSETETETQTKESTTQTEAAASQPVTQAPQTTQAQQIEITVTDLNKSMFSTIDLNVRSGPGSSYGILGNYPLNSEIKVTGKCSNGWFRVDFNGKEGYCSGKYLSNSKVPETTAALAPPKSSLPKGLFNNKLSDEQNAQALAVAQQIANSIPSDISQFERVDMATKKVYAYYSQCRYTMEGPYYAQAYGVFVAKEASCAGATRALGLVFSLMGIKWEHAHPGEFSHQWCRVWIDGDLYWADASIGYCGAGGYQDDNPGGIVIVG